MSGGVSSGSGLRQFHEEGFAGRLCASCRYVRGTKHGEDRGCKTRNEAEENRDHRCVGDGKLIGP